MKNLSNALVIWGIINVILMAMVMFLNNNLLRLVTEVSFLANVIAFYFDEKRDGNKKAQKQFLIFVILAIIMTVLTLLKYVK